MQNEIKLQWYPFCEATPFASQNWPFKRGGLLSGVEINTFMFRFTLSSGLSRGGGLSMGSTVLEISSSIQCKTTIAIQNHYTWESIIKSCSEMSMPPFKFTAITRPVPYWQVSEHCPSLRLNPRSVVGVVYIQVIYFSKISTVKFLSWRHWLRNICLFNLNF